MIGGRAESARQWFKPGLPIGVGVISRSGGMASSTGYYLGQAGGRLVILELLSHRFERARELYADQWLGFSEVQLHQWLEEAGFGKLEVTVVSREKESPHFQTVFATGSK